MNETTTTTLSPQSTIRNPQSRDRTLVKSAILASVFAAGVGITQNAHAGPVRFDNPAGVGHFEWTSTPGQDVLSVLHDAASQPGVPGAPGAFQLISYYGSLLDAGSLSAVQGSDVSGYAFAVGVASGEQIPTPGTDFFASAYIFSTYQATDSLLPEGQAIYLGLRFDPGDGVHYGWIGITRAGQEIDAFAWGYETEVGVPIAAGAGVPAPGALALLALGALTTRRRRRDRARN